MGFPLWVSKFAFFMVLCVCDAHTESEDKDGHVGSGERIPTSLPKQTGDQPIPEDIDAFSRVLDILVNEARKEKTRNTDQKYQEGYVRLSPVQVLIRSSASSGTPVIIAKNRKFGDEITLTSLLYKDDAPWSPCRRSCLTSRLRKCRMKHLCSMDLFVEEAYCYIPGSKCENTVKGFLKKTSTTRNEEGNTTTQETGQIDIETTTHETGRVYVDTTIQGTKQVANDVTKAASRYGSDSEFTEASSKEYFATFYDDPFIMYPSDMDYDDIGDFWVYVPDPSIYELGDDYEEGIDGDDQLSAEKWVPEDSTEKGPPAPVVNGECGKSLVPVPNTMFRIIGGREAIKGTWPWQVAILNRFQESFCGGTLISARWVVTAAHCIKKKVRVRVGDHDTSVRDGERTLKVVKGIRHPLFDYDTIDSDIGLLKLEKDVFKSSPHLRVSCLPSQGLPLPRKEPCIALGWGKERETHIFGADILQYVKVPIVGKKVCRRAYGEMEITENMFCAGAVRADACEGDSGGPLLCQDSEKRWVLHGIISFGEGCGEKDSFGVYVKVSNYIDWINETIGLN